jgi:hypothetical protein
MTRDPLHDVSIESSDDFEAVLAAAVKNATDADVDVRGAWEFRTRGTIHGWEITVFELANGPDAEE